MRPKRRTHQPLARLAGRQHGVVSTRQLESLGYSRDAIKRATASARLLRLHRGVYAVGHGDLSAHGHALAAVLACSPRALLSHTSAGWLWGFVRSFPATIDVTATTRRRGRQGLRLHFGDLAAVDRTIHDGIPVTAVPRTLLDLAAGRPASRLERWLERADELRLLDLMALDELLQRVGGHRGARRLRSALSIHRPSAFTRSGAERRFLELVLAAGLPRPSMNYSVGGYEVDAYWPDLRFGIEIDTFATHGSPAAFERDRLRQGDLKLQGVELDRVTDVRIELEPDQVVRRVAALLEQRRREIGQRR